jgi:hypothetical protein
MVELVLQSCRRRGSVSLRLLVTGGCRGCINQPSTLSNTAPAETGPKGGVFGARWTDLVRIVVRVQAAREGVYEPMRSSLKGSFLVKV